MRKYAHDLERPCKLSLTEFFFFFFLERAAIIEHRKHFQIKEKEIQLGCCCKKSAIPLLPY